MSSNSLSVHSKYSGTQFTSPESRRPTTGRKAYFSRHRNASRETCTVLALDPGGTTGWSIMTILASALEGPAAIPFSSVVYWTHGQIDTMPCTPPGKGEKPGHWPVRNRECGGVNEIIDLMRAWPQAVTVIEDFVPRKLDQSREFLAPVRVTAGVANYLYNLNEPYFTQMPALAKTTATDERLRNWGMYRTEGGEVHARDADRHALTFFLRAKQSAALRESAWPQCFGTLEK